MSRQRSAENRGLPKRWRLVRGVYYYQVPSGERGQWDGKFTFPLGKTLPEAYAAWAGRLKVLDETRTVAQLLDRYLLEVVPAKKPATQATDRERIPLLRKRFGDFRLEEVEPQHIYQYVDKRRDRSDKPARTAALHEMSIFRHVFTKAVEWGLIARHPFKGQIRLKGAKPRTRYVEDWELIEALSLVPRRRSGSVLMVQAYIKVKLLTGLRRGDLLRLHMSRDLTDEGIRVLPHKTADSGGRRRLIEWSEELRSAIDLAKAARPLDIAPWLFCTRQGDSYIDEATGRAWGWNSVWQRFMTRLLKETKITERFTEHDLRAKCGSDAESLERARELLGHVDAKTTERFYRRKMERVRPLR